MALLVMMGSWLATAFESGPVMIAVHVCLSFEQPIGVIDLKAVLMAFRRESFPYCFHLG